jgi:hypothetical protein
LADLSNGNRELMIVEMDVVVGCEHGETLDPHD